MARANSIAAPTLSRTDDTDAPVHGGHERLSSGLPQVRQADRDDEKGLQALPERDDECLQHCSPDTEIQSQFTGARVHPESDSGSGFARPPSQPGWVLLDREP